VNVRYGDTRHVRQIRLGDHLCLPFASDDEQREVLTTYIADGLRRGERVLYLADRTAPDAIGTWLTSQGVDTALAVASGQLRIRTAGQEESAGIFDPEAVVTAISIEIGQARRDRCPGLRITGEMSWALRHLPSHPRLQQYEDGVAALFSNELAAICQYDERLFDQASVRGLVARHPQVVEADPLHDDRRLRIVPTFTPRGLRVVGVVDTTTCDALAAALAFASRWAERNLHLNLRDLEFIDVAGVRAIVRAASSLPPGRQLHVDHLAPTLRKVISIVGWDKTPGLVINGEVVPE
jgi:anti-anti-sigma regulatory factor